VSVVVHDGYAGRVADVLEAALDPQRATASRSLQQGKTLATAIATDVPHLMNTSQTRLEGADRLSAVLWQKSMPVYILSQ
jgi:hypothetical protein